MKNLLEILGDKSLKGVARRQAIVNLIVDGCCTLAELASLMPSLDDKLQASILEALEEVSNKKLAPLGPECIDFATPLVASESNSCKREASRIVGNLAAVHPDRLQPAIELLMANFTHESTVVRWSAAYAMSRIIVLPQYAESGLFDELQTIETNEQEHGVKSQLTKALKKAARLRK